MRNIVLFSVFLLIGLLISQILPVFFPADRYIEYQHLIRLLTSIALGFIMIRVGYAFDIDKSRLRSYGWDYVVAVTSATLPWIFVALYFVYVLSDASSGDVWKESLLSARFAAPTSAGILFTMLAASGLAATWLYQKIRVLAIFDDIDTVLLMVVLQILFIGWKWQLIVVMLPILLLLWLAWRYLNRLSIPATWPWVLGYAVIIVLISDFIYHTSRMINEHEPIHIEVLLPAFVLGCLIMRRTTPLANQDESAIDVVDKPLEKRVTYMVSIVFMLLVGMSMPAVIDLNGPVTNTGLFEQQIDGGHGNIRSSGPSDKVRMQLFYGNNSSMTAGWVLIHAIIVTFIANLGKLFPLFCYRKEANWKERLALSIGMFPRGEVGAGVLVISMSYGIGGVVILVAMLSLTLNLLLTGLYIAIVKKLLVRDAEAAV